MKKAGVDIERDVFRVRLLKRDAEQRMATILCEFIEQTGWPVVSVSSVVAEGATTYYNNAIAASPITTRFAVNIELGRLL